MHLVLLALLFTANTSFSHAHTGEPHIVELHDNDFRPETVEIKTGEKVIFKNIGNNPHWPASDIHPTHQIYPAFDPKREIPPGGSWSFRLERAGTWKIHDHLYPEITGTIIVRGSEPKNEETAETEEAWGARMSRFSGMFVDPHGRTAQRTIHPRAYKHGSLVRWAETFLRWTYLLFPRLLERKLHSLNMMEVAKDEVAVRSWLQLIGPERAMAELLRDSGGGSTIDCHQQAHTLGRVAYELFGATAFEKGHAACHSGFYHGAMETFLQQEGTENIAKKIDDLCEKFKTQFGIFECLHGVGHGVLAYENYDLPEALQTCAKLTTDYDRSSCYGGLFMENIVTAQGLGARPAHKTTWASSDPHFPCNGIDQGEAIQYQCYLMQTSRMLQLTQYDFKRVSEECMKAPATMVSVCFRSLGRDIAGHTLRNPTEIVKRCGNVPQQYHDECIGGAVNVIVDFWGGGLKEQAIAVCRLLPEEQKRDCYSVLAGRLADIFSTTDERRKLCNGFEQDYQYLC